MFVIFNDHMHILQYLKLIRQFSNVLKKLQSEMLIFKILVDFKEIIDFRLLYWHNFSTKPYTKSLIKIKLF